MLMREKFPRAPEASLHFIEDKHCAAFAAQFFQSVQVFGVAGADSAFALDNFNDDRGVAASAAERSLYEICL
jgi:hypothetical protein